MISIIHPSRGRPEKAFKTFEKWFDKAGAPASKIDDDVQLEYLLSIDSTDPFLKKYQDEFKCCEWCVYVNDNSSVVEATNFVARRAKGDVLIYVSDDFDCPDNWWLKVNEEFIGITKPLLIKVDDCLQKFHVPVLTIPIMNKALYDKLGYFWNPEYKSMFVDEDLYWTARKLEALRMAPHLKFPHNHVSNGKAPDDETYRRSAANWNQGKEVFARRKAAGFPL